MLKQHPRVPIAVIVACCIWCWPIASVIADDAGAASPPTVSIELFSVDSPGWRQLDGDDFVAVNGDENTMIWAGSQVLCSGRPIGVTRTRFPVRNFELVIQWMHLKPGGNSGVFAWVPLKALENLPPNKLPSAGIEIQMLDHDYATQYTKRTGKPSNWFTTNGDVFAVGRSVMQPFEPRSPSGQRSFPTAETTRGAGQWNQYAIRGVNGEIRLWVNGVEVSGGKSCSPAEGYLCLEHEGSPIRFREIYLRELP